MAATVTPDRAREEAERAEWLEWRRGGIGSSDVAGILGLSRWVSPMSVWTDKTGLVVDDKDNEYMEYGRRAEPMVAGYFHDRTGIYLTNPQFRAQHPDIPHHRSTLDGLASETPDLASEFGALGVIEATTTGWKKWDEIPDPYKCQGQWQMHCTGLDRAWFAVLHERQFRLYEMPRDDQTIAILVEAVDEFWQRCVLGGEAPPADGHEATTKALARAFPLAEAGKEVAIDGLAHLFPQLAAEKAEEKRHKEAAAAISNEIKATLGEAEIGTIAGKPAVTLKTVAGSTYEVTRAPYRKLQVLKAAG